MRNRRPNGITLCVLFEVCVVIVQLPSFGVVFAQALAEVLVPARVDLLVFLVHMNPLWILFEIGHVMCRMSPLQNCIRSL